RLPVGVLSASTGRSVGDRAPGSVAGVPGARGAAFGPCAARGRKGVSAARVLADMQTPGGVFQVAFIPLRPLATPPPRRSPHPAAPLAGSIPGGATGRTLPHRPATLATHTRLV